MIILGICDSHEAHACIVRDGHLIAAMAEERLSRLKADMGYPQRSIDAVLQTCGISPEEIDAVAFAGQRGDAFQRLYKMNALFSVKDWIHQCKNYWKPILLDGEKLTPWDDFTLFKDVRGNDIQMDQYYPFLERARSADVSEYSDIFRKLRLETVVRHLGVEAGKVHFYRHEDCHKAYGIYSSPTKIDEAIVLTIEGGGDDSSATMSTFKNGQTTEHWASNAVNLGRLYRYVTLVLGMLPAQHEYKVMGLAPYGTEYHGKRARAFFDSLSTVEGNKILSTGIVKDLYYSVRDALEGERFDGIAWGLQTHIEDILRQWVENCILETGISDVVISGGVGQNIKACKHLIDSTSLNTLWAGPICGDGSLGIGASWLASVELAPEVEISGYETIYLGTEHDAQSVQDSIIRNKLSENFSIIKNVDADAIAGWIDDGMICARFSGRMEFGQRALGNRSILADPRRWGSVEQINQKIKYRDFWMPFTPSMTVEQTDMMIHNPKGIYSPYMTMAFDLKPGFENSIPAATHPADKTIRPQMLCEEDNPGYYNLLKAFGRKTGMECLLNTSFNLHGDAIVESPDDAVRTFLNSEIDVLVFDDVVVTRAAV